MGKLTVSLVRHGMTEGNKRREFIGSTNQPVSPEGIEELLRYAGGYPEVQAIFLSPMLRCRQTAELLYPGLTGTIVPGLRERDFGEYECLTLDEIIALPGNEDWNPDESSRTLFPGGEGRDEFYGRCVSSFREVAGRCAEGGITDAALVIHGGVIMTLMHKLCPPYRKYHDWWCANGCGYLAEWDGNHLTLLRGLGA